MALIVANAAYSPRVSCAPGMRDGLMHGAARRWSMLAAYACSGFGGLVYQVTWTRLLTLHVGHTTAAVAAVVAAFMGGLGAGAAIGSRLSARWSPAQCLVRYAALEIVVACYAIAFPLSIAGLTPVLRWAYADGGAGFHLRGTAICLGLVGIPAVLLGATFPISLRAFGARSEQQAAIGGRLYAANTAGAAAGAIAAGFFLLPAFGMARTTVAGAVGSIVAAAIAMLLRRSGGLDVAARGPVARVACAPTTTPTPATGHVRLAAAILIVTGFAGLLYEVAWTRTVASLLGPTTYAFAGTVSVLITGLALGGAAGGVLVARRVRPHVALAVSLTLTSAVVWWANGVLGDDVPSSLANSFATAGDTFGGALTGAAVTVFATAPAGSLRTGIVRAACARSRGDVRQRVAPDCDALRAEHGERRRRDAQLRLAPLVGRPGRGAPGRAGAAPWRRCRRRRGRARRRGGDGPRRRRSSPRQRSGRSPRHRPGIGRCSRAASTSTRGACRPAWTSAPAARRHARVLPRRSARDGLRQDVCRQAIAVRGRQGGRVEWRRHAHADRRRADSAAPARAAGRRAGRGTGHWRHRRVGRVAPGSADGTTRRRGDFAREWSRRRAGSTQRIAACSPTRAYGSSSAMPVRTLRSRPARTTSSSRSRPIRGWQARRHCSPRRRSAPCGPGSPPAASRRSGSIPTT